MRLRTSNPIYRAAFRTEASAQPVTYTNVAGKTVLLVVITAITGTLGVIYIQYLPSWTIFAAFGIAFVSSLLGLFIPKAAAFFSILYAATEGIVLGLISFMFEASYQGIVLTAVSTTVIVLLVMMILFSMNIVKVGQGFTSFLVVAMITMIVMSIVLVFTQSPTLYYLVCILSAILATIYLFLDFANIQRCVEQSLDHRVGWTLALGLMVSLVWLYIEILRLLALFAGRRR